jgi:hypothetical protein
LPRVAGQATRSQKEVVTLDSVKGFIGALAIYQIECKVGFGIGRCRIARYGVYTLDSAAGFPASTR